MLHGVVLALAMWNQFAAAHSVSLVWEASSSAKVTYSVYRRTCEGCAWVRRSSGLKVLAWKDTGVKGGKRYWYCVRAVRAKLESGDSNWVEARVP